MRIGILTFHRADNYGALLQTYALQTTLGNMGHAVDIIDYRCAPLELDYVRLYRLCPPLRRNLLLWGCEVWRRMMNFSCLHSKKEHCDNFRNEYLHMTKSLHSDTDRALAENQYDVIFTGSDQIWSRVLTHGKDDWYAFKRRGNHCVVASYGASVGKLDRFAEHFEEYRADLQNYDFLSVREKDAQSYLAQQLSKPVHRVIDPTLLVQGGVWRSLVEGQKGMDKPYILYYGVEPNEEASKIAMALAQQEKLPLVHFERVLKREKNTVYAQGAGPLEFLCLIRDAKYVVTSSFHGTVFSVLFQKQFAAVPHPVTGTRVRTLLQDMNLKNRLVETYATFDRAKLDAPIDFEEIDKQIVQLQSKARDYITQCIDAYNG